MPNANPPTVDPETKPNRAFWSAARARMILDPTVTMLNTGSFGPLPQPVFDRATELRRRLAAGPTDFFVRQAPPLLWEARERTAAFLGCRPERLIFTTNVSAAINLVASGLTLAAPGEILMTDHEYGAMIWCWERVGQRQGLSIRTFPLPTMATDPGAIISAGEAITPRTRLLFFSHVLSPTGLVLPAKELCAEARERGVITVVDGARPGHDSPDRERYRRGLLHRQPAQVAARPVGRGLFGHRYGERGSASAIACFVGLPSRQIPDR